MPKCIQVHLTLAELTAHGKNVEHFICTELRRHSIPVIGLNRYKGIRYGVMSLKRNDDGSGTFKWWKNAKEALDDGVVVPESPESKAKEELAQDQMVLKI